MSTIKKKLRIGIIGYKNHALRLIEEFNKSKNVKDITAYHPTKQIKQTLDFKSTNKFSELIDSDAVIIASPTSTHYKYIKALNKYKGYIFLEKPAVSSKRQENKILKFREIKSKIYVNYNFLFSDTFSIFRKLISKKSFGSLVHIRFESSHGLAFKKGFKEDWRAKSSAGVGQLVAVHFYNFILNLTRNKNQFKPYYSKENHSGVRNAVDTINILSNKNSKTKFSILCSYACPYDISIKIHGTNGIITYDGEIIKFYSPRNTLDNNGRYCRPPLINEIKLNHSNQWKESLSRSVNFFLKTVIANGSFCHEQLKVSLESMYPFY